MGNMTVGIGPNGQPMTYKQMQALLAGSGNPAASVSAPSGGGNPYASLFAPVEQTPTGSIDPATPGGEPYTAPAAAPVAAPAVDPWEHIAQTYGLGAPPAVGMPASIPATHIGPAPQAQPALMDVSQIPQPVAQQMPVSPQITAMAGGQGYAPDVVARMKANAIQDASQAGLQEMSQTKRVLGAAGIRGGAAAAVQGDVARRTGEAQRNTTGQIDTGNAQVGNENAKFGIGQETSIGQGNMQSTNTMALAHATALYAGLKSNQDAGNTTNQMNTGLTFQRQNDQANMDYNNTKSQWDELNKRFGQSQNILGAWGAAA